MVRGRAKFVIAVGLPSGGNITFSERTQDFQKKYFFLKTVEIERQAIKNESDTQLCKFAVFARTARDTPLKKKSK